MAITTANDLGRIEKTTIGEVEARHSRTTIVLLLMCVLTIVLLVLPGSPSSLLGGTPLSDTARAALALLLSVAAGLVFFQPTRPTPVWPALGILALCLLKLIIGWASIPVGWRAEYEMRDPPPATAVFFWRFAAHSYRVEAAIDLDGDRPGMYFLNGLRYNTGVYSPELREVSVPMRIIWDGYLRARGPLAAVVSTRGTMQLRIDDQAFLTLHDRINDQIMLPLEPGVPHHLRVIYDKAAGVSPLSRIRWVPSDAGTIVSVPSPRYLDVIGREAAGRWATTLATIAGLLAFLHATVMSHRRLVPRWNATVTAAAAAAVLSALVVCYGYGINRMSDRGYFMSAGNDPLGYEAGARDIMEMGLLMPFGGTLGHGSPYPFYPLYPYVLAGVHWVIGEDAGAIFLANAVLVAATVPLLWILGWSTLTGARAVFAVGALGVLLLRHAFPYTREAFTDNLYLPLVFATLSLTISTVRTRRPIVALLAGAVAALGAATRPSLVSFVALFAAYLLAVDRRSNFAHRSRLVGLLCLGYLLAAAPFALRNYIMSGHPVLFSSPWIQLPYFIAVGSEVTDLTARLSSAAPSALQSIAIAADIARAHPWRTLLIEGRKVGFTLGFTNLASGLPLYWEFVAATGLGLLALVRRSVPSPISTVTALFLASHMVAMISAAPWTYGYKSILPFQVATLFSAAFLWRGRSTTSAMEFSSSRPDMVRNLANVVATEDK